MSLENYLLESFLKQQTKRMERLINEMATVAENVATLTATNATLEAAIAKLQADFAAAGSGGTTGSAALDAITTTLQTNVAGLVASVETPGTTPTTATISASPSTVSAGATGVTIAVVGVGTAFQLGLAPIVISGPSGVDPAPLGASVVSETVTDALNDAVIINAPTAAGAFSLKDTVSGAFVTLNAV